MPKIKPKKVALFGFSTNMKWLLRLLQENGITPLLTDWREKYSDYDLHVIIDFDDVDDNFELVEKACDYGDCEYLEAYCY